MTNDLLRGLRGFKLSKMDYITKVGIICNFIFFLEDRPHFTDYFHISSIRIHIN